MRGPIECRPWQRSYGHDSSGGEVAMALERQLGGACELHEAIAGTAVLLCCPGGLRWWLATVRTMVDTAVS